MTILPIGSWSSLAMVKKKVLVSRRICALISNQVQVHLVSDSTHSCSDLFYLCSDHDMDTRLTMLSFMWLSGMYHFRR